MSDVVASAYLAARLKMLSKRLTGPASWSAIIDADLNDVLEKFGFSSSDAADLPAIEKKLVSNALEDFQLLFRPFFSSARSFLNHAVHWYELANLKALIRGKFTNTSDQLIEKELIDLGQFAVLPLAQLFQADDPHELLRLLENTPYSHIVRQARNIYEEEGQNLFSLDAAIDRHFFTSMSQHIKFLDENDQNELTKVFGALMDRLNLMWLVRYRFSYNLSPAKSFYLLATTGNRLTAEKLMQLASLESLDEVIEQLPEPINSLVNMSNSITEIEYLMEHYSLIAALNALKHSPSLLTRIFSYVILRESEIHLIQAIIKGKALGFDPDLIHRAIDKVVQYA